MRSRLALALVLLLLIAPALFALAAESGGEQSESSGEHSGGTTELIFKWLNFFLVFGGGGYFAAGPFRRAMAAERQAIREQIADAQRQREESRRRLAEIEQRLKGHSDEIEALRREARAGAAAEQVRLRDAAKRESDRVLATARAEAARRATELSEAESTLAEAATLVERGEGEIESLRTRQTEARDRLAANAYDDQLLAALALAANVATGLEKLQNLSPSAGLGNKIHALTGYNLANDTALLAGWIVINLALPFKGRPCRLGECR